MVGFGERSGAYVAVRATVRTLAHANAYAPTTNAPIDSMSCMGSPACPRTNGSRTMNQNAPETTSAAVVSVQIDVSFIGIGIVAGPAVGAGGRTGRVE